MGYLIWVKTLQISPEERKGMLGLDAGIISIGLVSGCLIGAIGVGGVIIVPALVYGLGFPVQVSVASAMLGYVLPGVIGTSVFALKGSIRWNLAGWVGLGAIPGAFLGMWASNTVDPVIVKACIASLALLSALNNLWRKSPSHVMHTSLSQSTLSAIGGVTGFVSALTGTSGPLVLVPILTWLNAPLLLAVGLGQAVQIPIATLATLGNLLYGTLDIFLGVSLAIALTIGVWFGARLAHMMPHEKLFQISTIVLILVGSIILIEVINTLFDAGVLLQELTVSDAQLSGYGLFFVRI